MVQTGAQAGSSRVSTLIAATGRRQVTEIRNSNERRADCGNRRRAAAMGGERLETRSRSRNEITGITEREEAKLNFLAPQPLHHFRSSRIFILLHGFLCALQVHVDRETTGAPRGGRHTYYVHQRLSGEESGSTAAFYDRRSSSASSCESGLRRRDVSAHIFVPRLDLYPEIPLCAHTQVLVSQGAERLAICARPDARRTSR